MDDDAEARSLTEQRCLRAKMDAEVFKLLISAAKRPGELALRKGSVAVHVELLEDAISELTWLLAGSLRAPFQAVFLRSALAGFLEEPFQFDLGDLSVPIRIHASKEGFWIAVPTA